MTLWIGNDAVLKKIKSIAIKRILKINNSWSELFNFQRDLLVFCKQTPFWLAAIGTLMKTVQTAASFIRPVSSLKSLNIKQFDLILFNLLPHNTAF